MPRIRHCKTIVVIAAVIVGFSFSSSARDDFSRVGSDNECIIPDGGRGFCKNIRDCPSLLGLLVKSRPKPWVIDFLRRSHCWFDGKDPVVCCPTTEKEESGRSNANVEPLPNAHLAKSCGYVFTLDKITGGSAASPNEFPWMALIVYNTKRGIRYRCGGSLISSRYVLTAAHCVTALKDIYPIEVRLGEYDISCQSRKNCSSNAKNIKIEQVIPHPDFYKPELQNDIALIRLAEEVDGELFRPVCLPITKEQRERSRTIEKGVVTGWGTTETGMKSQILLKATLPIGPLKECSKIYKGQVSISPSQICAGGESGIDSCNGDSGGPFQALTTNSDGEPVYVQYGIVSFGPRICGAPGVPGVYTRVAAYVDWIINTIKN